MLFGQVGTFPGQDGMYDYVWPYSERNLERGYVCIIWISRVLIQRNLRGWGLCLFCSSVMEASWAEWIISICWIRMSEPETHYRPDVDNQPQISLKCRVTSVWNHSCPSQHPALPSLCSFISINPSSSRNISFPHPAGITTPHPL